LISAHSWVLVEVRGSGQRQDIVLAGDFEYRPFNVVGGNVRIVELEDVSHAQQSFRLGCVNARDSSVRVRR
jgi:hypothetical protein